MELPTPCGPFNTVFASLLLWHQPRAVGLEASLTVIGVPSAYSVPSPFPSSLPPLLHGKVFTVHILPCGWAFASRLMLVPLILCVFLAASRSWPLTAPLRRACTCPQVTESSEHSRRRAGLAAWLSTAQPSPRCSRGVFIQRPAPPGLGGPGPEQKWGRLSCSQGLGRI